MNVQATTANKANEITAINHTTGAAWVTPGYDKAGNMIGIPNPTQTTNGTYDAWNRLISVSDASTSITNDYDARGFRIKRTSGGVVRHYYYTPGWQCVEERTGTLTSPERQFVWGLRYIDDLVIRDRSTANNGSINERRYAMQDGNWNTIAICDITGFVGERYAYSAYGSPVFMNGLGIVQTSSAIGFETLNAGYRFDGAAPQMCYVRNRFLLPMIGTWNKRDPLGYVDGMNFNEAVVSCPVSVVDPYGLQLPIPRLVPRVIPRVWIYVPPPEPLVAPIPPIPPVVSVPPVPVMIKPPPPWPKPGEPEPTAPSRSDCPGYGTQSKPWEYPSAGRNGSDCSDASLRTWDRNIKRLCNDQRTGTSYPGCSSIPSTFWSCDEIKDLKRKWERCANTRRAREQLCFRGGDATHAHEVALADYQVSYCYFLQRYWECPGFKSQPPWRWDPIIA